MTFEDVDQRYPQFLPDGSGVIYTVAEDGGEYKDIWLVPICFGNALTVQIPHPERGQVIVEPDLLCYEQNSTVELRATPEQGRGFKGWSGDVPLGHEFDNPLTIRMDSPKEITATFDCGIGVGPMLPLMAVGVLGLGLAVMRRRRK